MRQITAGPYAGFWIADGDPHPDPERAAIARCEAEAWMGRRTTPKKKPTPTSISPEVRDAEAGKRQETFEWTTR